MQNSFYSYTNIVYNTLNNACWVRGDVVKEEIYFYYTNDLHSDFEQWPRVTGFLKGVMDERRLKDKSVWLVDVGDHVDRVDPIAEAFMGKANVELMNDLGYDMVTIGNNEGITLSHDALFQLYENANFEVVCANLTSLQGGTPSWLQTSAQVESIHGVKIGVIGLTVPFNDYYHLLNWHAQDVFKTLDIHLHNLKEQSDVIILLSHLGINTDRQIAKKYIEIDVIIGGHTHHLLHKEEVINETIITAAGKNCPFVGEVCLVYDHDKQELVRKSAQTIKITDTPKELRTSQAIIKLRNKADEILGETVIQIDEPLEVDWFKNTPIIQKLTDTMLTWTRADGAMLNAGLLIDRFEAGDITYQDIHRICPHPINPVVVELTGSELLKVIDASFQRDFIELKLTGFGFRGEVIGRMIFSGIKVDTKIHENGKERVTHVTLNGEVIDLKRTYLIATADTFTFGRLLPEIAESPVKNYFVPEFLRDLLAYTLKTQFN